MKILLIVAACLLVLSASALDVSNMWCTEGMEGQLTVRVDECSQQPCTVRKGVPLPVEMDFFFDTPPESNEVSFMSFISYYAVPPNAYGMEIGRAGCGDDSHVGFSCPVYSGVVYTLKSQIEIHPDAVCTAGCDGMGHNGTGIRTTDWAIGVHSPPESGQNYTGCWFQVDLNITL